MGRNWNATTRATREAHKRSHREVPQPRKSAGHAGVLSLFSQKCIVATTNYFLFFFHPNQFFFFLSNRGSLRRWAVTENEFQVDTGNRGALRGTL